MFIVHLVQNPTFWIKGFRICDFVIWLGLALPHFQKNNWPLKTFWTWESIRDIKKVWIETYLQWEGLCEMINPIPPDIPKKTPAQIPVPIEPTSRWYHLGLLIKIICKANHKINTLSFYRSKRILDLSKLFWTATNVLVMVKLCLYQSKMF